MFHKCRLFCPTDKGHSRLIYIGIPKITLYREKNEERKVGKNFLIKYFQSFIFGGIVILITRIANILSRIKV